MDPALFDSRTMNTWWTNCSFARQTILLNHYFLVRMQYPRSWPLFSADRAFCH